MNKIEFQDYPSTETPLNAENLNQMQDNIENEIGNLSLRCETITGLNLGAGATYQLELPKGCLWVEPLVQSRGSEYSGGVFLTVGASHTYVVNNDLISTDKGIWMMVSNTGLVTISDYAHCGAVVTGFRIWHYGTK